MHPEYLKTCLAEVEAQVAATPPNAVALRKLAKQPFSFSARALSEQLIIWDYVWMNSSGSLTSIQAFMFCEAHCKDKAFLNTAWETLKHWQKRVTDWGYCDALSKIYTKVLEIRPDDVLAQLEEWNQSTHVWDRRQSLVSLLYYSRTKKVVLPFTIIIPLIDRLLDDPEYYVQKAVGWSLRELYNVYPQNALEYMEEHIIKIAPAAFSAATEKLKREDKDRLKVMRKKRTG